MLLVVLLDVVLLDVVLLDVVLVVLALVRPEGVELDEHPASTTAALRTPAASARFHGWVRCVRGR